MTGVGLPTPVFIWMTYNMKDLRAVGTEVF